MDVTDQILLYNQIYGASSNTQPQGLSASKSLNFANGASIQKPDLTRVTVVPFTLKYQGTTGLFGAENYFVRVNTDVPLDFTTRCFEEKFWECAFFSDAPHDPTSVYDELILDQNADPTTVNTYEPVRIFDGTFVTDNDSYISVDLNNLKTGNTYIDSWLDVRLYTKEREEHPYDKMYVRLRDYFYIGFHARNTRRLDYNVEAIVGNELVEAGDVEDTRYIAKSIA